MASSSPPTASRSGLNALPPESQNNNTVLPPSFRDITSELEASLEREAPAIAAHFGAELPPGDDIAARLALVAPGDASLHVLAASQDEYLVVGRHTEASVQTYDAPSLSLRHVLLVPIRPQADSPLVLDVIALAPTMRIAPWPRPLPAAIASQCSALVLGDALLLVAPVASGERHTEVHLAPDPAGGLVRRPQPPPPSPPRARPPERAATRHTRISSAAPAQSLPVGDAIASNAPLVLELRSGWQRVRIGVEEPWLVGGIVVGRNGEKCSHASLANLLQSDEVSRCHLYFRREGDDIVFYDTASTAGVWLGDGDQEELEPQQVRRFVMPAPRSGLERANEAAVVNPERRWLWLSTDVRLTL